MNDLNTIEQLVPVFTGTINGKPVQVCDARALHTYLENGDRFAGWIAARIEKYEFVENQDFVCLSVITETQRQDGQKGSAIHAWWECFGNKTVTASDLYRAISTRQCQILNDSYGALLGDIELWTAKKLGYALRRWSQLALDGYRAQNIGKSSHGITWRLELLAA